MLTQPRPATCPYCGRVSATPREFAAHILTCEHAYPPEPVGIECPSCGDRIGILFSTLREVTMMYRQEYSDGALVIRRDETLDTDHEDIHIGCQCPRCRYEWTIPDTDIRELPGCEVSE